MDNLYFQILMARIRVCMLEIQKFFRDENNQKVLKKIAETLESEGENENKVDEIGGLKGQSKNSYNKSSAARDVKRNDNKRRRTIY